MIFFLTGLFTAFSTGLLTTIHPCPLGTNIAGIILLSRCFKKNRIAASALYILGRITAYTLLGGVVSAGLLAVDNIAGILSVIFDFLLGPLLLITGMFFSGLLLPRGQNALSRKLERLLLNKTYSLSGSFFLGFFLSLAFCPATAALFFGVLVPLAVVHKAVFLFPALYGTGAGIPVVVLVILMLKSAGFAGKRLSRWKLEIIVTKVCGFLLILLGIYFTLNRIWQVF